MVFVHGESFSWGSGNLYDGRVLATYAKSVVVTFNYRLGIFGEFRKKKSVRVLSFYLGWQKSIRIRIYVYIQG